MELTTKEIDQYPSRPFSGFDWSEHPCVTNFIDYMYSLYEPWARANGSQRIKNQDEIRTHLMCLTLEAFRTYLMSETLYMAVPLGNKTIAGYKKSRYKPHHLSFRLLNRVKTFLISNDFLEVGFEGRPTGAPSHQRATRVRAINPLLAYICGYGVNQYMISSYPQSAEVIILRKAKYGRQKTGKVEEYDDTEFTEKARSNLNTINQFLEKQFIDIELNDQQEAQLNERLAKRKDDSKHNYFSFTDKRLKRIFNNSSFEQGGRFYGGFWQQIPKEYRFLITINESRTIQLDYSGMHFAMLYAMRNAPMPDSDPYLLDGYSSELRADIKTAFNILINCSTANEAIAAIDSRINSGLFDPRLNSGESVLNAFRVNHPIIVDFIATGEGLSLQYLDSQIAELIMLKGIEKDVCILPIHDGFITNTNNEAQLLIWMRESFAEVMGTEINVKQDPIYLEILGNELKEGMDASVMGLDGVHYPLQNYPFNKANSFTAISDTDDVINQIINSKNYKQRRDDWFRAHRT